MPLYTERIRFNLHLMSLATLACKILGILGLRWREFERECAFVKTRGQHYLHLKRLLCSAIMWTIANEKRLGFKMKVTLWSPYLLFSTEYRIRRRDLMTQSDTDLPKMALPLSVSRTDEEASAKGCDRDCSRLSLLAHASASHCASLWPCSHGNQMK